jgi:hypothetical protein
MRKSIFLVLLLGMSLFAGSAYADYNKTYYDQSGDTDRGSIDITQVKTTDKGSTVEFRMQMHQDVESSEYAAYAWYAGNLSSATYIMYMYGIGMFYYEGGYEFITVTVSGDELYVEVSKTYLPPSEEFDVYGMAMYIQDSTYEYDLCPETIDVDTDEDGLSDIWEIENFGNLDQGPGDDPDGDEYTNQQEHDAGTDPNDPQDYPQNGGESAPLNLMWIVLPIIIIIVVVAVVLALVLRGRKPAPAYPPQHPPGQQPPPQQPPPQYPQYPPGQQPPPPPPGQ